MLGGGGAFLPDRFWKTKYRSRVKLSVVMISTWSRMSTFFVCDKRITQAEWASGQGMIIDTLT